MDRDYRYKISNIGVVYEDQYLLIVDKPSGLITIPAPNKSRSLTNILNDYFENKQVKFKVHPCHRLDKETSGLIIYAKGKSIQKKMMREFKEKRVKKIYVGFIHGKLEKSQGRICFPIDGKSALTEYRVVAIKQDFTIVEIYPITGRSNQIRIHFKQIGHPLVGEDKFCFRRDFKLKFNRLCLHARGIIFCHPIFGNEMRIEIDLPPALKKFLDKYD